MSTLLNRIRSGADRAAFEADKVRRVTLLQSQERRLKEAAEQSLYQVGAVAYELYRKQRIRAPELIQVCEKTTALQQQVAQLGQEIQRVRNESYSLLPSYAPAFGQAMVCPHGHGALPEGARFCPICGEAAVAPKPSEVAFCPNCGASLQVADTRFCPECGMAMEMPNASAAPSLRSTPVPNQVAPLPGQESALPPAARLEEEPQSMEDSFPQSSPSQVSHEVETSPYTQPDEPTLPEAVPAPGGFEDEVVADLPSDKQCPNCGATLSSDALFCSECGYRVSSDMDVGSGDNDEGDGWGF